jgi:HAD superfamily hydrolase (TIGR01549 family)
MIKTILYDLDGTLRFNQPSGREFFLDYVATLGVPVSAQDRRRVAVWEHRYWAESAAMLRDMAEQTTPDAFWTRYSERQLEALGCAPGQVLALAAETHRYMGEHYQPQDVLLPGAAEVLAQLRAADYRLGVVSNRQEPFGEYLAQKGLAPLVDFSVSGSEAGSRKPDKGIFEFALRRAGSRAEETIYVGDNYFADVIGARAAGVNPVLFDPQEVFDEPGCPVIRSHNELLDLLDGRNK